MQFLEKLILIIKIICKFMFDFWIKTEYGSINIIFVVYVVLIYFAAIEMSNYPTSNAVMFGQVNKKLDNITEILTNQKK